jgi:hypothetical protein
MGAESLPKNGEYDWDWRDMNNEQDLIKTTGLGWAGLNCTALD